MQGLSNDIAFFQERIASPSEILLLTDVAANSPEVTTNVANPLMESHGKDPQTANCSSTDQTLPLDERLKLLLEVKGEQESVRAAKDFLRKLAGLKLDDPEVVTKVREHAALLELHVTGRELKTVKALQAKLDALPSLEKSVCELSKTVQQYTTAQADLEKKDAVNRERLQQRRTNVNICDQKLANLEAMRIDLEEKIAAFQQKKAEQNELLAKEISAAEQLKQTLAKTQESLTQATLEAEGQIVEFQKTIVDISSLGRRL